MSVVADFVVFLLPEDRELQFPAAAAVQGYVNAYETRMNLSDVSGGTVTYNLIYDVVGSGAWQYMTDAGLILLTQPRHVWSHVQCFWRDVPAVFPYDAIFDLTDRSLLRFRGSHKHAFTAANIITGAQAADALPALRGAVKTPRLHDFEWYRLTGNEDRDTARVLSAAETDLTGVIGEAGSVTYLAACRGFGVIELYPADRLPVWLAKWQNPFYRQLIMTDNVLSVADERERLIADAVRDVQSVMINADTRRRELRRAKCSTPPAEAAEGQ